MNVALIGNRRSRFRIHRILRGAGSVVELFPAERRDSPKLLRHRPGDQSARDWQMVGQDIWSAVNIVGGESGRDEAIDVLCDLAGGRDRAGAFAPKLEAINRSSLPQTDRQLEFDWD